jgi:hypothetical protein
MRVLICGAAMLIALISTALAAPMTPIPNKSKITKVGSCYTTCNTYGNTRQCFTNCY